MKILYKKNEELLKDAKNIFGDDVVEDAFLASWFQPELGEIYTRKINTLNYVSLKDTIDFGREMVIIVFKGGNVVKFETSEWADMTKIDLSNVKEFQRVD